MTDSPASLVLGPLLRYVGRSQATLWVETDRACHVDVLGHVARTFEVRGHHFALLAMSDLPEGAVIEYEVRLDGEEVWPVADGGHPASTIHTREGEDAARLVFGSCRVGAPQREPYTLPPDEHEHGYGVDALWAYSRRLQAGIEPWPDALLLCGDQVYADEVSPETAEFIRSRRDTSEPPGEEVADFEEYTRLYREAWTDPDIRWLLSTVPSLMIFDDHDVIDDWNISWQWSRTPAPSRGGTRGSPARSWRTGSISISGTSPRPSSRRSRCTARRSPPAVTSALSWRRSPSAPIANRRPPGGRAAGTSGGRGWSLSTPGPRACSTTTTATWWTTTSGRGSSSRATRPSTTWSS